MKPSIYGENERIISSNDNLELICEGGKELNWHYPLKLVCIIINFFELVI